VTARGGNRQQIAPTAPHAGGAGRRVLAPPCAGGKLTGR
jgi:hypothetical protein